MNELLAQSLAAIIGYLGPYPILFCIVLLFLAPLAAVVWVVWRLPKLVNKITAVHAAETNTILKKQEERLQVIFDRQDKRFEQFVQMHQESNQHYRDNVELVKNYERHTARQQEIDDKLIDLVAISTATQQQLIETNRSSSTAIMKMIENNEYCPWSRVKGRMRMTVEEEKRT